MGKEGKGRKANDCWKNGVEVSDTEVQGWWPGTVGGDEWEEAKKNGVATPQRNGRDPSMQAAYVNNLPAG